MSSVNIYVNSARRQSGETISNFTIPLQEINNIVGVQVKDYIFANSIYTINPTNNILKWTEFSYVDEKSEFHSAVTRSIAIPVSYYNATELANIVQAELNAYSDLTYTVSYDTSSNTYKIEMTGHTTDFFIESVKNCINTVLGFTDSYKNPFVDASPNGTGTYGNGLDYLISARVADLSVYKSLYVHSNISTGSQFGDAVINNCLFKIKINKQFSEIISSGEGPVEESNNLQPFSLTELSIRLCDADGKTIDESLLNNTDYEFTVKLIKGR